MKPIFIVSETEADRARAMERKLLSLHKDSGILFVGVEVVPDPLETQRRPLYKVFIGCTREREASLMHSIAKQYLRDFVEDPQQLIIEAHRGVDRSPEQTP
jgi:hypothetical protein